MMTIALPEDTGAREGGAVLIGKGGGYFDDLGSYGYGALPSFLWPTARRTGQ